jgi:tellurite resistance protein TerC
METNVWLYVGFTAFVLGTLALDLGVFHRTAHVVKPREAGMWIAVWMSLALVFAGVLFFWKGAETSLLFLTGYLIEQSLSADNIFVIVMIFGYFSVPAKYQHRVLFWGILGALVMRGLFIGMGALLIQRMSWIMYVFGAFLVFTGIKMALRRDEEFDAEKNVVMKTARRFLRITSNYHGQQFFAKEQGLRVATPFLVLLLVEFTDLVFAVDSIPAIFAVTTDPFLVYTSNVFAILGLRSMYFLLAGVVHKFVYLKYGLSAILTFVGLKMLAVGFGFHVPILFSLGFIIVTLAVSIAASLLFPVSKEKVIDEAQGRTGSIFGSIQPPSEGDER